MSKKSKTAKVIISYKNYSDVHITGLNTLNYGQAKYLEQVFRQVKEKLAKPQKPKKSETYNRMNGNANLPEGWTQDKIDDMIEWQNKQKKPQEPEKLTDKVTCEHYIGEAYHDDRGWEIIIEGEEKPWQSGAEEYRYWNYCSLCGVRLEQKYDKWGRPIQEQKDRKDQEPESQGTVEGKELFCGGPEEYDDCRSECVCLDKFGGFSVCPHLVIDPEPKQLEDGEQVPEEGKDFEQLISDMISGIPRTDDFQINCYVFLGFNRDNYTDKAVRQLQTILQRIEPPASTPEDQEPVKYNGLLIKENCRHYVQGEPKDPCGDCGDRFRCHDEDQEPEDTAPANVERSDTS